MQLVTKEIIIFLIIEVIVYGGLLAYNNWQMNNLIDDCKAVFGEDNYQVIKSSNGVYEFYECTSKEPYVDNNVNVIPINNANE
jgi:hypothetical protein